MSYNKIIRSDNPRAQQMLAENLEHFESRTDYMQKVNDYYREHGTVEGCPEVEPNAVSELDGRVMQYEQETPYPGRFFNDNFAEINRLKANIERLKSKPETVFRSWQFQTGEAVVNLANNRLQLMFNDKPSEEQRTELKKNGFKWAPSMKVWQRPLDFKSIAAADKIDFIKPLNGCKPSDLQPKRQIRYEPER